MFMYVYRPSMICVGFVISLLFCFVPQRRYRQSKRDMTTTARVIDGQCRTNSKKFCLLYYSCFLEIIELL